MEDRRHLQPVGILSRRITRRTAIHGTAGLAAAASLAGRGATRTIAARQTSGAENTIEQFYADVATHHYREAYALLSNELRAKQSLDAFTKGYADTAFVEATIVGTGTGQNDVQVKVTAWHNDGSIHTYSGTYTLNQDGDSWKIVAASLTEDAPPQNVAPLMRTADVDIALTSGGAAAGHAYLHLQVTNHAQTAVTAAGVPQLTLLDAAGSLVMASSPAQAQSLTPVVLQTGESAFAMFEWANWCEAAPAYPLRLQITLPGDPQTATIPYATSGGAVQAPRCTSSGKPATFVVDPFRAASRQ